MRKPVCGSTGHLLQCPCFFKEMRCAGYDIELLVRAFQFTQGLSVQGNDHVVFPANNEQNGSTNLA